MIRKNPCLESFDGTGETNACRKVVRILIKSRGKLGHCHGPARLAAFRIERAGALQAAHAVDWPRKGQFGRAAVQERPRIVWSNLDRPLEARERPVVLVQFLEHVAQVIVALGRLRIDRQRLFIAY